MDRLTPPHAPAPTPAELGEFGVRMADAITQCAAVAASVLKEAESPQTGRRPSQVLYELLRDFDPQLGDLGRAFRESGNRWPSEAGDSWSVIYDTLVNGLYSTASRLVRSLADERRGDWTLEESAAAEASESKTIRLLRSHADYLSLIAANVRAAGGEDWQVVNLESELKEWFDRFNAGHREGTVVIGALRRGAAAPLLTGLSMKVVPGRVPSHCQNALPVIKPAELLVADRAIRQTVAIPDGMTTHWVGDGVAGRLPSRCDCCHDAPYATPDYVQHLPPAVTNKADHPGTDAFERLTPDDRAVANLLILPGSKGKSAQKIIREHSLRNVTVGKIRELRKLISNSIAARKALLSKLSKLRP